VPIGHLLTATRLGRLFGMTQPCPEIRWDEVVRIEAMGFDAIGPFEIAVSFVHADGREATLFVHHEGYEEMVTTLHHRFPSIPPTWYDDMMAHPDWHVERVLFSQDETRG
jgi:hypothetical protein